VQAKYVTVGTVRWINSQAPFADRPERSVDHESRINRISANIAFADEIVSSARPRLRRWEFAE
jgi:hypothetical protein